MVEFGWFFSCGWKPTYRSCQWIGTYQRICQLFTYLYSDWRSRSQFDCTLYKSKLVNSHKYKVNPNFIHLFYHQSPVTALTWGHNDKRIFVSTGKVSESTYIYACIGINNIVNIETNGNNLYLFNGVLFFRWSMLGGCPNV
jgi:hypothetical protein